MRTRDSQYAQYEAWKTRLTRGLRLEQISIHAPLTVVSRQIHKRKKRLEQMPFCQFIPKQHLTTS